MHIYYFEDPEGEKYYLNDSSITNFIQAGSMSLMNDSITFQNKIVERSGQAGSVQLGTRRLEERKLTLTFSFSEFVDSSYISHMNDMIYFLSKATYLADETSGKKIKVSITSKSINYDNPVGTHFQSSDNTIEMIALNPYWESLTDKTITQSLTGGDLNTIEIDNQGFYETQGLIEITSAVPCATMEMYLSDSKQGMSWNDPLFGNVGYQTVYIDNENGTVEVGNIERSQFIESGTGFFAFPKGISQLKIIPAQDCDISISFKERSFI